MKHTDRLIHTLHMQMDRLALLAVKARDESAQHALTRAKGVVPVRTGRLRASITRDGGKVYTLCPYARFVELGTIRARPQPFLSVSANMHSYRLRAESAYREAIR